MPTSHPAAPFNPLSEMARARRPAPTAAAPVARVRHAPPLAAATALLALGSALLLLAGCGASTASTPATASAAGAASAATAPGAAAPAGPAGAGARPVVVGVQVLKTEALTLSTELPGRTSAPLVAEIRPQVGGLITARAFTEGAAVRAGQTLYQIDPAPWRAALASADAALARAEATRDAARLTAERKQALLKADAGSAQDAQDAQATLKQAEADLAAARAAQDSARINLARTTVTSPISGRVDVSTVTRGALVTADQATALTTVRQLDPIQVDITQSAAELLALKRELAAGRLQRAEAAGAAVTLVLEDGSAYAHRGRLSVSGVSVNSATGAVTLRALFPNPEGLLLPGMYVRAQLPTATRADALLVPQQAVSRDAAGSASVLVVQPDGTVAQRAIVAQRAVGNRWRVDGGLRAGEQVVVEGGQKVRPGDKVQAQALAPAPAQASAQASPQPLAPQASSPQASARPAASATRVATR